MRILIVNTLYEPLRVGGAEQSVKLLATDLSKRGNLVGIITLSQKEGIEITKSPYIWRLKLENLYWGYEGKEYGPIKKFLWHLKDVENRGYDIKIKKIFNEFNPDIVHTNNLSGFSVRIWKIASQKKIKIVHTLRDYYLQCPKTTKFKLDRICSPCCLDCSLLSSYKRRSTKLVNSVVGISQFILKDHLDNKYFPNAQPYVIYNGIDLDNSDVEIKEFDNDSVLKFGFIGQLTPSKGIYLLIKGLSSLKSFKKWKLYIAGSYSQDFQNHIICELGSDRVELLGFVEPEIFYKKVDVLIIPSLWGEPFGRVIIEGLKHGLIILASNRGAIPEILKDNEEFIFEPTVEGICAILKNILIRPVILNRFSFQRDRLNTYSQLRNTSDYLKVFEAI